jgi:hypothetical protein
VDGGFADVNLYVYNRLRGVFYDAVIWCLGPLADDSREYGLGRCLLALATRSVCRVWIAAR